MSVPIRSGRISDDIEAALNDARRRGWWLGVVFGAAVATIFWLCVR